MVLGDVQFRWGLAVHLLVIVMSPHTVNKRKKEKIDITDMHPILHVSHTVGHLSQRKILRVNHPTQKC